MHAEVAVWVVCWDFVELEELLMLVRISYRMEVDDRRYLFSDHCWRSSDFNLRGKRHLGNNVCGGSRALLMLVG